MIDDTLLPLLPSLLALVDEQGVTRAAGRMRISQPRMSARLATLRRLLADPLLVPAAGRRGVVPTTRALELAATAKEVLDALDSAVSGSTFDPLGATRTFTIMANDNASLIVGVPLIDAVRAASGPGVRVALLNYDPLRLRTLENGELDLVLGSSSQLAPIPSLIARTVVRDRFMTASNADRGEAGVTIDDFCARDHVVVSGTGGGFDSLVDEELARSGRSRRVAVSVQSYLVALELVASSDLLATLPGALMAHRRPQIRTFEPPLPLAPFGLAAGWHLRSANDPSHRWLREMLTAVSRSYLPRDD